MLLVSSLWIWSGKASIAYAPTNFYQREFVYIQNSAVKASGFSSPLIAKIGVLGDLIGKDREYSVSELKSLVKGNILNCLIEKESSWRIDAIGDSGKAFGLLQFHWFTFEMFSKKYNLPLNYYLPQDQILLAGLILSDDFNNIRHWSVASKCLK